MGQTAVGMMLRSQIRAASMIKVTHTARYVHIARRILTSWRLEAFK